jgi:hypothetical protein
LTAVKGSIQITDNMKMSPVEAAADNNARWCDAIARAHGCTTQFVADAWFNTGTPPPYNSHLVTLRGGDSAAGQARFIRERLAADPGRPFGFKDSFHRVDPEACLDEAARSAGRQFGVLFEASWIWLEPKHFTARDTSLRWERVTSKILLSRFERAWRGDESNADASPTERQFPTSLLCDSDIAFFIGMKSDDKAVAVAIANRTGDVVGLSNVFGAGVDPAELWQGATAAAQSAFDSTLPLVGYERGDDLTHATQVGFQPRGQLRVLVLR